MNQEENKPDIAEQNQNNNQDVVQTEAAEEPQQPEDINQQDSETQVAEKNSHTARNVTLVGAALALVTLGVMGRKGKLGPKIQKFLGGAEKAGEKGKLKKVPADYNVIEPESKEPKINDIEVKEPAGKIEGKNPEGRQPNVEEQPKIKPEGSEPKCEELKVEEVVGEQVPPVTEKAEAPKPVEPNKPVETPKKAYNSPQTNAKFKEDLLDRSIPNIPESAKSIDVEFIKGLEKYNVEDIIKSAKLNLITGRYEYSFIRNDGSNIKLEFILDVDERTNKLYRINRYINGKLDSFAYYDDVTGKLMGYVSETSNINYAARKNIIKQIDNQNYIYDLDGKLEYITSTDSNGITKKVHIDKETSSPIGIEYIKDDLRKNEPIKVESEQVLPDLF